MHLPGRASPASLVTLASLSRNHRSRDCRSLYPTMQNPAGGQHLAGSSRCIGVGARESPCGFTGEPQAARSEARSRLLLTEKGQATGTPPSQLSEALAVACLFSQQAANRGGGHHLGSLEGQEARGLVCARRLPLQVHGSPVSRRGDPPLPVCDPHLPSPAPSFP